jgi:hypothetical protein
LVYFTIGGPSVGFIRTNNTYKETVAVISGGVTGLFRVKDRSQ